MNSQVLPDIPRLYTALAEWLACLIYILLLRKRVRGIKLYVLLFGGLVLQGLVQYFAGLMHPFIWGGWMLLAVLCMLLLIFAATKTSLMSAGYFTVRAFIFAEFMASLQWQLYCYFDGSSKNAGSFTALVYLFVVYALGFTIFYFFEKRHMPSDGRLKVAPRELFGAVLIGFVVFAMSNISFVFPNTPFSSANAAEIFYIRTLVDFGGTIMLYTQLEQRRESDLRRELLAMDDLFHRQYDQYRMSKENDELIGRKYHDLKHQIESIRVESDPAKRDEYLQEMDRAIRKHEAENRTGNSALDTILFGKSLYCTENNINFTCVADGALLNFIEVMDICSIFGNALDNAIESVEKLENPDKRLITLNVSSQKEFIIIRFENYCETTFKLKDDLPRTTKKDTAYHGFGLKSIRATMEKYDGSFSIRNENNWFSLHILIPVPE